MYKQYFKQAWNLMRQNRFYSGVYIIGTGLAISMVMVIAIVYHIRTADITPEVHRGKYLYIDQMKYEPFRQRMPDAVEVGKGGGAYDQYGHHQPALWRHLCADSRGRRPPEGAGDGYEQ